MNRNTTISLSVEEIEEAVRFWLERTKGEVVQGRVWFKVDGVEDPGDYHAALPLSYELTGATCIVENK